ncbi:MAG: hypothetical protein KJ592_02005, partial [Nanoarchaeota archaeon]|nr:hypothetical protein [Nanoarchaeota archaeon]
QSVSEMEDILKNRSEKGILTISFTSEQTAILCKLFDSPTPPTLIISCSQFAGILDTVRNIVLDWSLKLEADGILGKDLTFSEQEKQKVSSTTYNIQNLIGIAGEVKSENIQIGGYNLIHSELKKLGIPQSERNELENILDGLKTTEKKEEKQSLIARGMDWLKRNASIIGTLSEIIRNWIK